MTIRELLTPRRALTAIPVRALAVSLLLVSCTDSTGPSGEVDTNAPSIEITSLPANAIAILSSAPMVGSASDDVGVTEITYRVNGGAEQQVQISGGTSSAFDFEVPLAMGENRIVVTARDAAGGTASVERVIDRREMQQWVVELVDAEDGTAIEDAEVTIATPALAQRRESSDISPAFSATATRAEPRLARSEPRLQSSTTESNLKKSLSYEVVYRGNGVYYIFVPDNMALDFTFSAGGFAPLTFYGLTPESFERLRLIDEALIGPGTASGLIIDGRTGEPLADVDLCIALAFWRFTVPVEGCEITKTDSQGRYSFQGLTTGYYTVFASKLGYSMGTREIMILGSRDLVGQDLTIEPQPSGTLAVSVNVAEVENAPSAFKLVVDHRRTETIAPNGTLTFPNMPAGEHTLELEDLGPRCTVSPNPMTVEVVEWGSQTVVFSPICSAPTVASEQIVFTSARHNGDETNTALFRMNADGTGIQPILSGGTYIVGDQPSLSPDGTRIAFRRALPGQNYEIFVVNMDGTGLQNLTSNAAWDQLPDWSPDGQRIAFTSSRDGGNSVWLMDADGGNLTRVGPGASPSWSPDGQKLAFAGSEGLVTANLDGSGRTQLVANQTVHGYHIRWSPDGQKLVFTWNVSSNEDIYVLDLASRATTRKTYASAHDYYPSWSPDGSQISFNSDRQVNGSTNLEIYLMDAAADETTATPLNLSNHPQVDHSPSFPRAGGGVSPPIGVCSPSLLNSSALPGQTVQVSGIPTSIAIADLVPTIKDPATGQEIPTGAVRTASGVLEVVVPIHPSGNRAGGVVELRIASGSGCAPLSLTISPLPSGGSAAEVIVASMQAAVQKFAARFGVSVEMLKGDISQLPRELTPLAVMQGFLDHPANPNSLVRMLNGTAPALNGQTLDLALLNSVLVSSGAAQGFEQLFAVLDQLEPSPSVQSPSPSVSAFASSGLRTSFSASGQSTLIRTAEDLDRWMGIQQNAASIGDGLQFWGEPLGHAMTALSIFPQFGAITTSLGMLQFFTEIFVDGLQNLLPNRLSALTISVDRTTFNEDEDAAGHWGNARLTAYGSTWSLKPTTLASGWLNAIGASGVLMKRLGDSNPTLKSKMDEAIEEFTEVLANTVNTVAGGSAFEFDGVAYVLGPYQYGPVDVTDARWTNASVAPTGIIRIPDSDRQGYLPVAPGSADLIVKINPHVFGDNLLQTRQKIHVKRIAVRVEPSLREVEPGQITQFVAAVFHANDDRVTWEASGGSIDAQGNYTAPQQVGDYTVTAISVANPDRRATATVRVRQNVLMRIDPESARLAPGQTYDFDVVVEGTANTSVQWAATGGTIDSNGNYTAPQQAGTYMVTARSVANPDIVATAEVRVSDEVMIRIIPGSATVTMGNTFQFRAEVEGTANTEVGWSNTGVSAIDNTGLFSTAPIIMMGGSPFITVTARSKADPSVVAHATVSLSPSPPQCPIDAPITHWEGGSWSACTSDPRGK